MPARTPKAQIRLKGQATIHVVQPTLATPTPHSTSLQRRSRVHADYRATTGLIADWLGTRRMRPCLRANWPRTVRWIFTACSFLLCCRLSCSRVVSSATRWLSPCAARSCCPLTELCMRTAAPRCRWKRIRPCRPRTLRSIATADRCWLSKRRRSWCPRMAACVLMMRGHGEACALAAVAAAAVVVVVVVGGSGGGRRQQLAAVLGGGSRSMPG